MDELVDALTDIAEEIHALRKEVAIVGNNLSEIEYAISNT